MSNRRRFTPRLHSSVIFVTGLLLPALAFAWSQEATFMARVHQHEFSRATLKSEGCKLQLRLFFDAPEAANQSESKARNEYRVRARVNLDGGRALLTPVFHSLTPGARSYDYTKDTASEACWAKTEAKILGVDVEGCRGASCTPAPFK
ncbi:MAG: hypothetical protein ABI488_19575 [Polyangiaceae bacterium]